MDVCAFFYEVLFLKFDFKKLFSCFAIKIFDSEATGGSSVKICLENSSSWIIGLEDRFLEADHTNIRPFGSDFIKSQKISYRFFKKKIIAN